MPIHLTFLFKRIIICLLVSGFVLPIMAQPVARFNGTPLAGCSPLIVNFTDQSTGSPNTWRWDLGNGTFSQLQNPSATYFNPGQYNIKLVISNAAGVDSVIKNQFITVYSNPTVNFVGSPLSGCYPLPVQFISLSNPGSGTIESYEWDFGDGFTSNQAAPSHIYTNGGNYNISLRIRNSFGCVKTLTKPAYIQILSGVRAGFNQTLSTPCTPPVTVNFQNTSTGVGLLSYQWIFGDGATSSNINPTHTYLTAGSYTVKLIVTNATGCSDTLTKVNTVAVGTVAANFSLPSTICAGQPVPIINTSIPIPNTAFWNFGDGTTSTAINPVKIFLTPGTYLVKLIDDFGACKDSITKSVTVIARPVLIFTANQTTACKPPLTVNFNTNAVIGSSYQWYFGDGDSSSLAAPNHTYMTAGSFSVKLIVTNGGGCRDTLEKSAFINISEPEIRFNNLPAKGCAPFTHSFFTTINSPDPVTTYLWNFGDGSSSTDANLIHTFGTGNFTISLIITTAGGCSDTAILPNGIRAGIKPTANFNATPREVCAFLPVDFHDLSTGNANEWIWNFGDGDTSHLQNPGHVYADTGYFTITLIAMNNGCADTIRFTNYIYIKPPISNFIEKVDCANPTNREFIDKSVGADTWLWEFGDGTTSTIKNPIHNYSAAGVYNVKLTITNTQSSCSHFTEKVIYVITEKASFRANDTVICKGDYVQYQSLNTIPNSISSYSWEFGDGATDIQYTGTISHQYLTNGFFTVKLFTLDKAGCKDSITKPLYIYSGSPTANFRSPIPGTCLNSAITFVDSSFSDGVHSITNWSWDYGDGTGTSQASPPFQHAYAQPGNYTVSLKVTDSNGCADSTKRINHIIVSKPQALFITSDTVSCPAQLVNFINQSTGPVLVYAWDFGDGSTSNIENPLHAYNSDGFYTVRLKVRDQFGCVDSVSKVSYIRIATPIANFLMSDSVSNCPPLVVSITNTSANYASVLWDFGDSSTSNAISPTHFYSKPGTYLISMIATSPGGCTSRKTKQVIVRGPRGSFDYTNVNGCTPLNTSFKATSESSNTFLWDFNDGSTLSTNDSIVNHVYETPGIYLPKLILIDPSGCQVPITGLDSIKVVGVKASFTTTQLVICDSSLVSFANTSLYNDSIISYKWDFGDNTFAATVNASHYYNVPGVYRPQLIIVTAAGCTDTAFLQLPIKVIISPQAKIIGDSVACVLTAINFSGESLSQDTSTLSWKWNFGNGNTSGLQTPPSQVYSTAGIYTVSLIVSNNNGCRDSINKIISIHALPEVRAAQDSFICRGQSYALNASGASSYAWTPSTNLSCSTCADPIARPDSNTLYVVTGRSNQGCMNKDSVVVSVKQKFAMIVADGDTICTGKSIGLAASGAEEYLWSPNTGLSDPRVANPKASPTQTTTYTVIGRDRKGCFSDTAFVQIFVYTYPLVTAGPDKTISSGQSTELLPVLSADVTNVLWTPSYGLQSGQYPAVIVKPMATTEYTVQVSNIANCKSSDKVTVFVTCNNANVFVPNTFSPNGDGANDVFYVRGSGVFRIKSFRVFNRWGEMVHEKTDIQPNDPSGGWDGKFKGVLQSPDVFVFMAELVCDNSSIITTKGNVTLVQ